MTTVILNSITRKVEAFSSARDVQARAYGHDSKPALEAANVPPGIDHVFLRGYAAAGDGGAAHYKRVASEPGHPGKIQSNDSAWWEIDEARLNVKMFGTGTAAFQAAIDTLATNGGRITVPPDDYSTIAPASLTTGSKVVTWDADRGVTLPADMPGAVISQGIKDWWASGGAQRTGDVYSHVDLGDQNVANGRHRAFHVQGHLDNHATADDRFLAAYSFYLETDHASPAGGSLRGVYGSVHANGGQANIRAVRVVAESDNGHTGNLTGVLGTAVRNDAVDGVTGSVGTVVGIVGTVGAGGTACFEANAFAADQRPSFAFRVSTTDSNALLPESACYAAHGGGNGDLFRGVRGVGGDPGANDVIFSVDNKARIMARSFFSGVKTIADDTAIAIDNPAQSGGSGFFRFWGVSDGGRYGEGYFRATAGSAVMTEIFKGVATVAFMTGALTGTTGTDGNMTVSAHTDGKIYLENRSGTAKAMAWAFISTAGQSGHLT